MIYRRPYTTRKLFTSADVRCTHCKDSVYSVEVISPGHAQNIGKVEAEVDEPPAGSSQVGLGEESTDEETLHDGGSGKRRQEEKDHGWVAVWQDVPPLEMRRRKKRWQRGTEQ